MAYEGVRVASAAYEQHPEPHLALRLLWINQRLLGARQSESDNKYCLLTKQGLSSQFSNLITTHCNFILFIYLSSPTHQSTVLDNLDTELDITEVGLVTSPVVILTYPLRCTAVQASPESNTGP